MVVALGPGKFYGSSLPRPHIYTDVKLSESRIDPPMGIFEPFLSWAHDAHWSMGGLSFKRLRLQGRIEGNIKRLRSERKKQIKNRSSPISASPSPDLKGGAKRQRFNESLDHDSDLEKETLVAAAVVAAAAPAAATDVAVDGSASWIGGSRLRRKRARKLVDDFDRVAERDGGVPEVDVSVPWSPVEEKTIIINKMKTKGSSSVVVVEAEDTVASRTRKRSPRSETTDEETPSLPVPVPVPVPVAVEKTKSKSKSKSIGGRLRSERRTEGTTQSSKSNSMNDDLNDSPPRVIRTSPRSTRNRS